MTARPATSNQPGQQEQPVSTGRLPLPEHVRTVMDEAHVRYRDVAAGDNSRVYPALAAAPRERFGIALVSTSGACYAVGDAELPFSIMSVSKPFVFALVCQALGAEDARAKLGVNATGLPFNSVMALELSPQQLTNPMVNAGALATTSLIPGASSDEKWQAIHRGLSRFAGRELALDAEVYASALATNYRNRGIAALLRSIDRLYFDAAETTELYTRQCSLAVTARDLAVMGATLANGGVNPLTGDRVIDSGHCRHVLAVMATAGLYETSGDWLYDIGLPGKSGIGGGIVSISPGKGGMGTFAPPLDAAGNSVRGQLAARFLSERLGLNLFASAPATGQQIEMGMGEGER